MDHQLNQVSKNTVTCKLCKEEDLYWSFDFGKRKPYLVHLVDYGGGYIKPFKHECSEGDVRQGRCKSCKATNLVWIRSSHDKDKWELTEEYGLPHICKMFSVTEQAHAEAKRIDYQYEKKWVESIITGYICLKCAGTGTVKKSKKAITYRRCKHCKGVGQFFAARKRDYLKNLRRKYWPYRSHHTWNPK